MSNSEKDVRPHSRGRQMPELCEGLGPLGKKRAQGKPDARCTRGLVCNVHKKVRTRAYRSSGGNPAFPARWVTAYFVLSPVTGFVATVIKRIFPQNLAPAPGRQDHTTSPSATTAFVFRRHRVHRIPPHVRDDRDPPLSSGETHGVKSLICPTAKAIYFCAGGWTSNARTGR